MEAAVESRKRLHNEDGDPDAKRSTGIDEKGCNKANSAMVSSDISVPNSLVGLIIGRGGDMISRLQSHTGCRIQIAPDPPSGVTATSRAVTLFGTNESVESAKQIFCQISATGKVPDLHALAPGSNTIDVMIPANKVGMVIGKQGDMIRSLQQQSGCKMVMIQDGTYENAPEKPLRITGEPVRVAAAKQLVNDMLAQKELEYQRKDAYSKSTVDSMGVRTVDYPVLASKAGAVIGKGGESIRNIMAVSGAHVEINRNTPPESRFKSFIIRGHDHQIQQAREMINEKTGEATRMPQSTYPPQAVPIAQQQPQQQQPWGYAQPQFSSYAPAYSQFPQTHYPAPAPAPAQATTQHPGWQPTGYTAYQNVSHQPAPAPTAAPVQVPAQVPAPAPAPVSAVNPAVAQPQQDYSAAWAAYYQQYYTPAAAAPTSYPVAQPAHATMAQTTTTSGQHAAWPAYQQQPQQPQQQTYISGSVMNPMVPGAVPQLGR